jgi:hypothetical protein
MRPGPERQPTGTALFRKHYAYIYISIYYTYIELRNCIKEIRYSWAASVRVVMERRQHGAAHWRSKLKLTHAFYYLYVF